MKWWITCLLVYGLSIPLAGQSIIWEKSVHLGGDRISSISNTVDGNLLCGGATSRFGQNIVNVGSFYGSVLIKYNQEGDTFWIKNLKILGDIEALHLTENGLIWAVMQRTEPYPPSPIQMAYFPGLILLSNDSTKLLKLEFPELNFFEVGDSYPTVDGGLIVFGNRSPSFIPSYEQDFYAFKVDALGNLQWSRPYNPGPTKSFCQGGHVEPMANGNFLVSGSMGSRIVSFEIDPETGNDTNFVQWYQTPSNHLFDVPGVVQSPDSLAKVIGTKRMTPNRFYFGNHKSATQKLWGGEQLGGALQPIQNADGSCILIYGTNSFEGLISKVNADSTIAWHISSTNASQIQGRKVFYDCLYFPDQSGILVGYNLPTLGGTGRDFYIAKFSGIGEPFDPTGVKQPQLVKPDAIAFPNPTNTSFRFKKDFQKGEMYLFTITGKRVLSLPKLLQESSVDVSGLAAGTYLYRAVLDGRPHWGKIVKQ